MKAVTNMAVSSSEKFSLLKALVFLFLFFFSFTFISAWNFDFDGGSSTVTVISNGTDTNESVRFNVLTGTDCSGTDKMVGVANNGAVVCGTDTGGSGGNTTAEIFAVVDNSTFIKISDLPLGNRTRIVWQNITNLPTCTGSDVLTINTTHLYCTTVIATGDGVGQNSTFEGNYSNYVNKTYLQGYGYYNATNYFGDGVGQNDTWGANQSNYYNRSDINYLGYYNITSFLIGNYATHGNVQANSSPYYGYYNSTLLNSTQLEQQTGNILGIKWSWLASFFNTLFGTKTTDDLTQGTTNFYDNKTWNESRGNTLYIEDGTQLGNTSLEIRTAINNSGFYNISINYSNVLNHPSMIDTFNTTAEIWVVVNNGTFMPIGTKVGNTTNEIWGVADNNTFIKLSELPLTNRTLIVWQNITNLPTCGGGANLFYNGSHLNCTANVGATDVWSGLISGNRSELDGNINGNLTTAKAHADTNIVGNRTALDGNILGNKTYDTFAGNYSDNINRSNIGTYGYYNATNYFGDGVGQNDTWGANQSNYYNRSDINYLGYYNGSTWNTAWNQSGVYNNWYNSSLVNATEFEDQAGKLGIIYSWLKNTVLNLAGNFTYSFTQVDSIVSGNRTAIEAEIVGNRTAIEGLISGNLTTAKAHADTNIVGNRTALDGNINGNLTAAKAYTNTNIVGNRSAMDTLIDGNGTRQWRDQAVNTTSNVLHNTFNITTTLYMQFSQYICFGNATHICWSNVTSNQTHLVERG